MASWRSGDAADCKSVYTGSIPVLASKNFTGLFFLPHAKVELPHLVQPVSKRIHRRLLFCD